MLSALKVLLVEDHAFQRRLGLRLLESAGVQHALEAADGEAALAILQAEETPVDVVLIDLDLPGMDGVQLIRAIADGRCARAVALVSASDAAVQHTVAMMSRAAGLRMLGCVEKPLTAERLQHVLETYLQGEPAPSADLEDDLCPEALARALAAGEIHPYFQPQVELRSGRVLGVEALARWHRSDGSVISAGRFIHLLEQGQQTAALAELTLRASAQAWRGWVEAGLRLKVSINLSAADLHDASIADRYEAIARDEGIPTDCIVLELTESSVIADTVRGLGTLARLRLKGFGLSIDDFGTGYSSFSQLAQLPFTELKLDRSFVSEVDRMPKNRAMLSAALDLARRLHLEVVAEGVERVEEWQVLAELGCDAAQGWLIAPAVSANELPSIVQRWHSSKV